MKKGTKGYILIGIGLLLLVVGFVIIFFGNFDISALGFFASFGGAVLICFGRHALDEESSHKTPQPKPQKPFDPWIQTPKVEKKEDKDDVPKIWEDRVLAGG